MAKKMARNGRTKDIYKGTFVCIQTLGILLHKQAKRQTIMHTTVISFQFIGNRRRNFWKCLEYVEEKETSDFSFRFLNS